MNILIIKIKIIPPLCRLFCLISVTVHHELLPETVYASCDFHSRILSRFSSNLSSYYHFLLLLFPPFFLFVPSDPICPWATTPFLTLPILLTVTRERSYRTYLLNVYYMLRNITSLYTDHHLILATTTKVDTTVIPLFYMEIDMIRPQWGSDRFRSYSRTSEFTVFELTTIPPPHSAPLLPQRNTSSPMHILGCLLDSSIWLSHKHFTLKMPQSKLTGLSTITYWALTRGYKSRNEANYRI